MVDSCLSIISITSLACILIFVITLLGVYIRLVLIYKSSKRPDTVPVVSTPSQEITSPVAATPYSQTPVKPTTSTQSPADIQQPQTVSTSQLTATPSQLTATPSQLTATPSQLAATTSAQAEGGSQYMGCYKDDSRRYLGYAHISTSDMTRQKCVDHCTTSGFKYAAVQDGSHCFCDNPGPRGLGPKIDEAKCKTPCRGNKSETCGGDYANNIFSTTLAYVKELLAPTPVKQDQPEIVMTPASTLPKITEMPALPKTTETPALVPQVSTSQEVTPIVQQIAQAQMPSQVQQVQQVQMPSTPQVQQVQQQMPSTSQIQQQMPSTPQVQQQMPSTSQVQQQMPSTPQVQQQMPSTSQVQQQLLAVVQPPVAVGGEYMGCYRDDKTRYLQYGHINTFDMTKTKCIDHCSDKGFKYAGLQSNTHCFCGNPGPRGMGTKLEEKYCKSKCIGNSSQICGGEFANSIYTTGK